MARPITFHQAEVAAAQAFADEWVEQCLHESWLHSIGIDCSMLDPHAAHVWLVQQVKSRFVHDIFARAQIVHEAEAGWVDAQVALGELIQEYSERKEDLPDHLRVYHLNLANPHYRLPAEPRAQKADHVFRTSAFTALVALLHQRFRGLNVYGRSARRLSIIAIAARAFAKQHHRIGRGAMDYETGRKIWRRLGTPPRRA